MTYSGNEPNGDTPSGRSLEQEIQDIKDWADSVYESNERYSKTTHAVNKKRMLSVARECYASDTASPQLQGFESFTVA